jgi:hypothetical protein
MRAEKLSSWAGPVVLVAAVALFVDLFLDWRVASVTTPAVDVTAGDPGWARWGIVAGVLLIAVIVRELRLLARPAETIQAIAVPTVLALAAAGFAAVAFFTGSANVEVGGVVAVSTEEIRWPAYVGLVLAAVIAAVAIVRYVAEARAHPAPPRTTAHGAV